MFADEVFVFTPNGDVKSLPAGATPSDFAYSVHSAVGNRMVGAQGQWPDGPYDHQLSNGEHRGGAYLQDGQGPSRDWLKIAKSNEARNKIRQCSKREAGGEHRHRPGSF